MARYHFNPDTGKTGQCRAEHKCRFELPDSLHASSPKEAARLYEESVAETLLADAMTPAVRDLPPAKGEIMYHGSPNLFEEFAFSAPSINGQSDGRGFNLSNSVDVACGYGEINGDGYVYEVDFVGKRGIEDGAKKITMTQWQEIVDRFDREEGFLEDWGDVEFEGRATVMKRALSEVVNEYSDDATSIGDIMGSHGSGSRAATFYSILHEVTGIDHIVKRDQWGPEGHIVRIATIPSAVKIRRAIPVADFRREFNLS